MSSAAGRISELQFMAAAMLNGYVVAQVMDPGAHYDVLVSKHHLWQSVQVKTAWRHRPNSVRVSLQRASKYGADAFDLLGIVYQRHVWLMPWYYVCNHHTVVLSILDGKSKWGEYKIAG